MILAASRFQVPEFVVGGIRPSSRADRPNGKHDPAACLQLGPSHLPRVGAMSGLLHPVGPESVHPYWARRAVLFGAAAVLAIAAALIIHGTSSGSEAQPNQPPAAYPVGSPTAGSAPAMLPANPKAKSLDKVFLPQSGPRTYQAAGKSVLRRPRTVP